MGFVDTHLHLLPGLDDGPATMDESLALAEAAIADGTTDVIATPHANYQFGFFPERVTALRDDLQARLAGRLHVTSGCELHLSYENVQAVLANPRFFTLNQGRYLLVEFPEFFESVSLLAVLEQFCGMGLVPVLAHPERNPVFQQKPEVLYNYLRVGCLAQVTASSFGGRFGKQAQQFSAELLEQERVHIVASDGHSAEKRSPRMSKASAFIEHARGADIASALCRENPLAMLEDRDLPYFPTPAAKKKSLWARLRS